MATVNPTAPSPRSVKNTSVGNSNSNGVNNKPSSRPLKKKKKKIVIKPFSKPPSLPEHFYDESVAQILETLWSCLLKLEGSHTSSKPPTHTQPTWSLQQAYSRVVDICAQPTLSVLLYKDVVASLKKAAAHVLREAPSHQTSILTHLTTSPYPLYLEYCKVVRHVLLPLDRAYLWQVEPQTAISKHQATTTATTTTSAKQSHSTTTTTQTLWQVALSLFQEEIVKLQLDEVLQEAFWQALWTDFSSAGQDTSPLTFTALNRCMSMWHDWNIHTTMVQDVVQPRLVASLQRESERWQQTSQYNGRQFLQHTYHTQYQHVHHHWSQSLLPKMWVSGLLELYLWEPHLNEEFLLKQDELSLTEVEYWQTLYVLASSNNSVAARTSSSSKLERVIQALLLQAKTRVQQCLVYRTTTTTTSHGSPPTTTSSGSSSSSTASRTVEGLLQVQRQLQHLQRSLGAGSRLSSSSTTATTTQQQQQEQLHQQQLDRSLKQMWSSTLNEEPATAAEILAKYMDLLFKSATKLLDLAHSSLHSSSAPPHVRHKTSSSHASNSSSTLAHDDTVLNELLTLFCHLQAKDVFEAFYKKDLAKRLVLGKVQHPDQERHFLSLLKSECGAGYTSKMEGMFQDVDWSRETMSRYKAAKKTPLLPPTASNSPNVSSVEMDVKVLTTGYWPVYPQYPNLVLPECLVKPQGDFLDYYKTKYQGRRMQWQYALGSVDVRAQFDRQYHINMSVCPALVLLCFNEKESWTLPELQQAVGFDDPSEMGRILYNLALGKVRLLLKHDYENKDKPPEGPPKKPRSTVDPRDTFTIRKDFTSKQLKIRIFNLQAKESKEERDKTLETVSRDRLYLIDAVLVRILKARKSILHQQLIPQVMEQIKVPAQPADIKLRIESLIEREYMERDAEDRNRYNYLA